MKNISVCSWSYRRSIGDIAAEMRKIGVDHIQLALTPFIDPKAVVPGAAGETSGSSAPVDPIDVQRRQVEELLASGEWTLCSSMFNSAYEDYTTPATIRSTGGIMPDEHWPENKELIVKAARLSAEWKAPYFMLHAGFMDESDPRAYATFTDRVKFIRDTCGENGVELILETGQERPEHLAEFLSRNEGIYVNLDPANIILYDMGEAVPAVKTLAPWIRHLHIKDSIHPRNPGEWGEEVPWGEGQVDASAFLKAVDEIGFTGYGAVEREAGNDRAGDIAKAVERLRAEAGR